MLGYRISKPYFDEDHTLADTLKDPAPPNVVGMTMAVQRMSHIYAGTVPYAEVARRRRRNKVARRSRRVNRLAARR